MKMNFLSAFLTLSLIFSKLQSGKGVLHKICTDNFDRDACQQIARDQEFACVEDVVSMVDCFLNLEQGLPQVAFVKPEEAFLAAPLVSENVVVIGEVFGRHPPYQTAVIVRKPYDGGFENLSGKRFCHPGFKHIELVTRLVLEEFESKIISLSGDYCTAGDNSSTILEKRVRAIANFFGSSCRPGSWTESDELDAELKSKYPSLCELCGIEKCGVTYQVPFNETLSCLTNRGGDIALTTLIDAEVFFNGSTNIENFQYLCPNGSVSDASSPCTWTNQLNRLIVTDRTSATFMKSFVENKLSPYLSAFDLRTVTTDNYLKSLEKVLRLSSRDSIRLTDEESLHSFVAARRSIPSISNSTQCSLTARWCTLNDKEQQKCRWLAQAALNSGFQPAIECIKSNDTDTLSCLNDIKAGKADITFTDVNYGYIALKKGLNVIAYTETDTRQLSSIVIVVRENETSINSLNDLKGKQACFPEYGGKEWLSFIDTLRFTNVMENSCNYGKIFSDFVGSSCVPGARSGDYTIEDADESKLCSQCIPVNNTLTPAYCNPDDGNKYFGTDGALQCLKDLAADYAVITINDISALRDNTNDFRVLSKNGSLSQYTGFNVDEKAPLNILTAGVIVAKNESIKRGDIVLLLRGIELEFGQSLRKSFKAFESFNATKDLLFPDSTPGLTFGGTTIKYVENFKQLLINSEKCIVNNDNSDSCHIIPSVVLTFSVAYFILRF